MKRFFLLLIAGLWLPTAAPAETPEEKGLRIAREADAADRGFGDFTARVEMVLRNRHGKESRRSMRIWTLEMPDDGDRSITLFDSPPDVRGTALLTWSHGLKPDDQWLYLPALKRVKRISSRNKSGPFMGSEFAYEDLGSQEVEKYRYRYLREEPCGEWVCHVIERVPAYRHSGYRRQIAWIDREHYRVVKVVYHDRRDALLKTLEMSEYAPYLQRHWRPGRMTMVNHQTGKSTVLEWSDYRFRTGLSERDFQKNRLRRLK